MIQRTTKEQGYEETLGRIVNSRRGMRTFLEVNADSSWKDLGHCHNFCLATIDSRQIHVISVLLSRLYNNASETKNNGHHVTEVIPMLANKADVFAGKYCSSITFSSGRSTDGFPDRNVLKYKASSSENVDSLDSRLPASGGRRLEKSLEKKEALSLKSAFIYSYNPNKKEFLPPSLSPQLPNEQLKTTGILTSSNENVLGICSAPVDYKTSTSRARKGFSSITITARRLIPPVNVPPTFSGNASLKQFSGDTPFNSRSFHTSENCLDDMCYRRSCKSRNVRKVNMTASRNNYSASEGCSGTERIEHKSSQTRGHNKENEILLLNTDGKKEFSAKSPKGLVHSCVYFRVSPHLSQANFYLDKPLFIPILGAKPSYAQQKHRSTFSLYVNGTSTKQTLNATNALLKEVTSKKETGRQNDKKESSNVKFKKEATALSSSHYRLSHFFRNTPQENATSVTCELLKKSNMLISDETDNCLHMIGQHVRNHCMVNGPLNEVQGPAKSRKNDLGRGKDAEQDLERIIRTEQMDDSIWPRGFIDIEDDVQTALTLKEALEFFRPDFITRSRKRLKDLEQKRHQRRVQQNENMLSPRAVTSPGILLLLGGSSSTLLQESRLLQRLFGNSFSYDPELLLLKMESEDEQKKYLTWGGGKGGGGSGDDDMGQHTEEREDREV
ncbi:CJ090 protein, partial [Polypterus senegalus]